MESFEILENQVRAGMLRLPTNNWLYLASFSSSAKCARPMSMLNAVIWSLVSESPEKNGILSLSVRRILMTVISFVMQVLGLQRGHAWGCRTCYFMDFGGDIMHRSSKNDYLVVCCKVIGQKKLSSCCLRIGVIGGWWCDGTGDALRCSFVALFEASCSARHSIMVFIITITVAIFVVRMALHVPVRLSPLMFDLFGVAF